MELPEKVKRQAGNLNDGQSYERKLLLFIAASLSQNEEVDNFWIVSNPTGIDKIDDVVARVSFKDSGKKDIAVFVQAKLTSPDKLLWLSTPINKKKPTKYCYEIKLTEYEKAFNNVVQMMSSNKPETQALRKLLQGVDEKDYFVCIFTNMEKVDPELQCKQFDGSHPIHFLDTRKCGQYRQFDFEIEKFNSNFYKQLYVFLGQPNFEDIDSSIAQLLGEDYQHRLANLDEIVKKFMQRNKLCWVLTKPSFEMNWFKVLVMDWMYIDSEKIEEINPKFERLWQKILADQKVINLREDKIYPLLAFHYQCVIAKEVDENFDWREGMTLSTTNSIKQKYGENVSDLKELLFFLWSEGKLPLAIKSDCTQNILEFFDQFETMSGSFVVFSSEDAPEVITDIKQISESVVLLEEAMTVEVSLQGRSPVALSDICEWQVFSELKIAQVLAWTNNLEDGRKHIVGPVLRIPDEYYITRSFTRKHYRPEDQKQNDFPQYFEDMFHCTYVDNATLKQDEETVEHVIEHAGPGLHIITGEPGMGKSTVLEELAHKYSPKDFVIYVILRDFLEDIESDDTWPSIEADPIQHFFNKMAGKSDDIIAGSIFQNHKTTKRLCIFLDGLDEILPLHGIKLSSLIASILNSTAIPIFCTTRPHGEEQITKNPYTTFLELSPLGEEQIRQYLKKIKKEAKDIGKNFDENFLSNPLHLSMLSQIYENVAQRNDIITRGNMYKIFIESKHDAYNNKIGLRQNYARRQTERSLKYHRQLATVDIFGRECVTSKGLISDTELDEVLEDIGEHNIGIVDVSKQKGKFRFNHRTFAEYLVADWLLEMANQGVSNKTHFKYFYEKVMRNHRNICCMINEVSRYHVLWSEASKQLHINSDLFNLDEFGRNVAHAAMSSDKHGKLIKSVCKSRLFYRKDAILQRTCSEFVYKEPNENGSTVVYEINKDYPTRTPLTVSELSSSDICNKLLTSIDSENKENINSILETQQSLLQTGLGIVAFHSAITTGNESVVKLLLDLRPMLLNEQDDNQNTALHIACAFGCRDILLLLLKKHANLHIVNKKNWSPLEMAAAEGQLEIVSLLLNHIHQIIDVGEHASSTARHKLLYQKTVTIATRNERWDVVVWLIEHGADPTQSTNDGWGTIHFAAQEGQLEILTLLFEKGVNVNAKDNTGRTPLTISIDNAHWDSVKWLLDHGADPTLPDENGWTAMHLAIGHRHLEILALLLESGHSVNAKANTGWTPLFVAVFLQYLDTTKWLLEHGADPTLCDNSGKAVMHFAAQEGHLKILDLLLERGLNVNAKTNTGATPLYIAIQKNHLDTTKLLLDNGADPTLSDNLGRSAMHYAAKKGQVEILKLLLERGLNVNAKTNTGTTPLNIAIQNNHLDTTKWLLEHGADATLSDEN